MGQDAPPPGGSTRLPAAACACATASCPPCWRRPRPIVRGHVALHSHSQDGGTDARCTRSRCVRVVMHNCNSMTAGRSRQRVRRKLVLCKPYQISSAHSIGRGAPSSPLRFERAAAVPADHGAPLPAPPAPRRPALARGCDRVLAGGGLAGAPLCRAPPRRPGRVDQPCPPPAGGEHPASGHATFHLPR